MNKKATFNSVDPWDDVDVISRLLKSNPVHEPAGKSLRDEFLEVGEKVDADIKPKRNKIKSLLRKKKQHLLNKKEEPVRSVKKFCLSSFMQEFSVLSTIMDQEIEKFQRNLLEERKSVSVLEEYLEIEQKSDRVPSLKEALNRQKTVNLELQKEFNKILDDKENELVEANAESMELRSELSDKDKDVLALGWENEKLSECLVIKDEYVVKLKLQSESLECQYEQAKWKLEQSEDLLEMVEDEREKEQKNYKLNIERLKKTINQVIPTKSASNNMRPPPGLQIQNESVGKVLNRELLQNISQKSRVKKMNVNRTDSVLLSLGWSFGNKKQQN